MSILGIMVLITLLLALDIADPASPSRASEIADAAAVTPQEVIVLETQLNSLRGQHELLVHQVEALARVTGGSMDLPSLESGVEVAEQQVEALAQQAEQLKSTLDEALADQERAAEIESEALALQKIAQQLLAQMSEQQSNPTLRYLPQANSAKSPVLVSVSADALGVGGTDPAATAVWFTAHTASARRKQLVRLLRTMDARRTYCVVLVKPDAFDGIGQGVMESIRDAGFDVGMDLLRQKEQVLLPAEAGS